MRRKRNARHNTTARTKGTAREKKIKLFGSFIYPIVDFIEADSPRSDQMPFRLRINGKECVREWGK